MEATNLPESQQLVAFGGRHLLSGGLVVLGWSVVRFSQLLKGGSFELYDRP